MAITEGCSTRAILRSWAQNLDQEVETWTVGGPSLSSNGGFLKLLVPQNHPTLVIN